MLGRPVAPASDRESLQYASTQVSRYLEQASGDTGLATLLLQAAGYAPCGTSPRRRTSSTSGAPVQHSPSRQWWPPAAVHSQQCLNRHTTAPGAPNGSAARAPSDGAELSALLGLLSCQDSCPQPALAACAATTVSSAEASGSPLLGGQVLTQAALAPPLELDDDQPLLSRRTLHSAAPPPALQQHNIVTVACTPSGASGSPICNTSSNSAASAASPVRYAAVFLTPASREVLLGCMPARHPVVRADHMTLDFEPCLAKLVELPLGAEVLLRIIGSVCTNRLQVGAEGGLTGHCC